MSDHTPIVYGLLRKACHALLPLFHDGIIAVGTENLPKPGEATILAFSHSNDLADMLLLLEATKTRYIRYGAASVIFKFKGPMAVLSWIAKQIGAVPVVRAQDMEGDDTAKAQANRDLADRMLSALGTGHCVGLSPEGGSRHRVKLHPFAPGVGVFAERAVLREALANGRSDFSVRVVPVAMANTHWFLWRSAAMVRFGRPIVVDMARLARSGVTADIKDDTKHPRHFQCVDDIMGELRAELSKVAFDVPGLPGDPDKSKILEGDFAAVRHGIVAARLALFEGEESALPPIHVWFDAVRALALSLQSLDQLRRDLGSYQEGLVRSGLRDQLIGGHGQPGFCNLVVAILFVLMAFAFLLLALPGAVLYSPILLFGYCVHWRAMQKAAATQDYAKADEPTRNDIKKCLKQQLGHEPTALDLPRDDDLVRRRRNFDTIAARGKGIPGVFYFFFLVILSVVVGLGAEAQKACSVLHISWPVAAAGLLVMKPVLVWLFFVLSLRALDEACAFLRKASGRLALFRVGIKELESLRADRKRLRQSVLEISGVGEIVDKAHVPQTCCQYNYLFGRARKDWMETLSLTDDLTLSMGGLYEPKPFTGTGTVHTGYDVLDSAA